LPSFHGYFIFGLQAVGYCNTEGYLTTHLLTSRFGFKCSFPILVCACYLIEMHWAW